MSTKPEKPLLPYKDNPAVQEVFADSMELLTFNGQYAHLTLTVNRLEETAQGDEPKGTRTTAARVVMSPNLLTTLYNKMSQLVGAMEQQGLVTRGDKGQNKLEAEQPSSPLDVQ